MTPINIPALPENERIREITIRSVLALADLMTVHEEQVTSVLTETEEGPISLAHAIKVDLGKNSQTDKLSFSLKHSDEVIASLDDPAQGQLPIK